MEVFLRTVFISKMLERREQPAQWLPGHLSLRRVLQTELPVFSAFHSQGLISADIILFLLTETCHDKLFPSGSCQHSKSSPEHFRRRQKEILHWWQETAHTLKMLFCFLTAKKSTFFFLSSLMTTVFCFICCSFFSTVSFFFNYLCKRRYHGFKSIYGNLNVLK